MIFILSLIFVNVIGQQTQIDVKKAIVRNWIIYQGDTLAVIRMNGDSIFYEQGVTVDTIVISGTNYWTLDGSDNISNNNAGDVTLNGQVFVPDIAASGTKYDWRVAAIGIDDRLFPKSIVDLFNEQQDTLRIMSEDGTPPNGVFYNGKNNVTYNAYQWHILDDSPKDNLVYRHGDTLWIATKFNANYDLIIQFFPCMFNKLMTFYLVGLASNTGTTVSEDITRTPVPGFLTADGDNIGPIQTNDTYGSFIGGSHGNEGTATNLAENFSSGTYIRVATPANFVATGGTARLVSAPYSIFTYASVSGDTLKNVDLTGSYTTSAQIQRYDTSATTISYAFLVDGNPIADGDTAYCYKAEINVVNHIFDPLLLPSGIRDTLIVETVNYDVSKGNIDVDLTHEFQRTDSLLYYFGMQSRAWGNSADSNIYYAHGSDEEIVHKSITGNSGAWSTYKDVEKIVLSNGDKSLCQAMWMDLSKSYMTGRSSSLQSTDYAAYVASYKTYWNLVNYYTPVTRGMTKQWRGVYTWFDNSDITNDSVMFRYYFRYNDREYLAVDIEGATSETVTFDESKLIEYEKDATITYPDLLPEQEYIELTSTDYGNVYFQTGVINTGELWDLQGNDINYSNGNVEVGKNIVLESSTSSSIGNVFKGANRFLHDYKPPANTGQNLFLGVGAGNFTMSSATAAEASFNTGVGYATQDANTTGAKNTSLGWNTLGANTTGNNCVAIGYEALQSQTTSVRNVAIGSSCLRSVTNSDNVGIGALAGYTLGNAAGNVLIGTRAMFSNSAGSNNTIIGYYANHDGTGAGNTIIGMYSGYKNKGNYNIIFGFRGGYNETGSYKFYLAADSTSWANGMASGSKLLMYGDMSNAAKANHYINLFGKVSIGAAKAPAYMLDVTGTGFFADDLTLDDNLAFVGAGQISTTGNGTMTLDVGTGKVDITGDLEVDGTITNLDSKVTAGYTIPIFVGALTSPVDATTYYFGNIAATAPSTTADERKMYIPKSGTITFCEIATNATTAGTNEAWPMYIRLNNTTDYEIATVSANTNLRMWKKTDFSIAVVAGDYIEIKTVTPTWATNPATFTQGGYIYIEQ